MTTNTLTKPELVLVDANDVNIEDNIRHEATPDADFLRTVEAFGILTPVSGRRDSTGKIHVRIGQRRTLAARATGVPLPVIVFDADNASAPEPAWLRTATQVVENDHRKTLTSVQRAAAYRQLELDGLSVPKIAGKLGVTKETVKAGIAVAKAPAVAEMFDEVDIDLIQMATIAEFEEDSELVSELVECATEYPAQFEHTVARARRAVADRNAIATREAELRAEGKIVLSYDEYTNSPASPLSNLHRDESIEVDPTRGDGIAIVVQATYNGSIRDFEVITDPAAFGYKSRYGYSTPTSNSGPMTDEQKEERRQLIANNKAWFAAETVRRQWLATFLTRKAFPKDAASFIAIALTRFPYEMERGNQGMAHELLEVEQKNGINASALADIVEANPAKAGLVTLTLVIAKLEGNLSKETWRSAAKGHADHAARFFFLQLREWGYSLSPVEAIVIGEGTLSPDTEPTDA